jgi:hypothetical protein
MNATQATATMPMGINHFPSVNGPATSLWRPDVTRIKIGAPYEVYRPMTAALRTPLQLRGGETRWREYAPGERVERGGAEPEQATDASENNHKPNGIYRSARGWVHALEPPRAWERVVAREREHGARRVDALRRAAHELHFQPV